MSEAVKIAELRSRLNEAMANQPRKVTKLFEAFLLENNELLQQAKKEIDSSGPADPSKVNQAEKSLSSIVGQAFNELLKNLGLSNENPAKKALTIKQPRNYNKLFLKSIWNAIVNIIQFNAVLTLITITVVIWTAIITGGMSAIPPITSTILKAAGIYTIAEKIFYFIIFSSFIIAVGSPTHNFEKFDNAKLKKEIDDTKLIKIDQAIS
jgi:hypothetical protein